MAAIGDFIRPKLPENIEFTGESSTELHVLAVDDSLVDRTVIERLLKISSCKVTAVESGTRALQYLGLDGEKNSVGINGLKVNLIITDYSMPGMTGYELLKKIKESSTFREVPVVIMSSENIMTRIDRCLEEGADEFILKPVKLSDVKRLKSSLIKGEGKESDDNIVEEVKLQDDTNSIKIQSGEGKTVEKRKYQGDAMNSITPQQESCNVAGPQEHHPESPLSPKKRTKLQTAN